jgi:Fic/DOC family
VELDWLFALRCIADPCSFRTGNGLQYQSRISRVGVFGDLGAKAGEIVGRNGANVVTRAGLQSDGVFLGERDDQGEPLPEFIGARPQDLQSLVHGTIDANERMREGALDSVLQAATTFGFVYLHSFQDGNGRLHRRLPSYSTTSKTTATRCAPIRDR